MVDLKRLVLCEPIPSLIYRFKALLALSLIFEQLSSLELMGCSVLFTVFFNMLLARKKANTDLPLLEFFAQYCLRLKTALNQQNKRRSQRWLNLALEL